jgi:hypothetical protein
MISLSLSLSLSCSSVGSSLSRHCAPYDHGDPALLVSVVRITLCSSIQTLTTHCQLVVTTSRLVLPLFLKLLVSLREWLFGVGSSDCFGI